MIYRNLLTHRSRLAPVLICTIALFCLYPGPVKGDDRLTEILGGILDRYGNLPGLTVPYQRDIITKSMAILGEEMKGDHATGKIYFKPPHYLSIKQETPDPEPVTTDGHTLWWYIPKKELVYQYPSERLGKELLLLGDIFQGLKSVGDNFDVIQSDLGDREKYHLRLVPNPPWEEIDHIDLTVEKKGYNIKEVEIHNFIGNITRFTIGDLIVRKDLDIDFFRFTIPKGVRVIKEE